MVELLLKEMEKLRRPSGAFIAAPSEEYNACWLRDQLYISLAYYYLRDFQKLKQGIWVVFDILKKYIHKIEQGICSCEFSLHAKYHPDTFEEITEHWGHHQLDALGLLLYLTGYFNSKNINLFRDKKDIRLIQLLVFYIQAVRYWEQGDFGMWENDFNVHSSSVGAVVAGFYWLEKNRIVTVPRCLIESGREALRALLPNETYEREVDMALLSLIWPYNIVSEKDADVILTRVKEKLVQEHGLNRYIQDSYYCSGNGIPAEWPMGFFWLSIIASQRNDIKQAEYWLNRGLEQKTPQGYIPELYTDGSPNKNTPLAWAHSLAIIAHLKLHEQRQKLAKNKRS